MIIWGSRGMNKSLGGGPFHCPRCGPDKFYQEFEVNKWFTLYFIPVIPLGSEGRYIKCRSCAGTFDTRIKNYDPEEANAEFEAKFDSAVARTALLLLSAGGAVSDEALENLSEVLETSCRRIVEVQRLREVLSDMRRSSMTAKNVMASLAPSLSNDGKNLVLNILSASVQGGFSPAQRKVFEEAGVALGFRRKDLEDFGRPALTN
jgi:hypothetical protein